MDELSNNLTLFNSFEYNATLPPMFNHSRFNIEPKSPFTMKPHFLNKSETVLLFGKPMKIKEQVKIPNKKVNPDDNNSREGKCSFHDLKKSVH